MMFAIGAAIPGDLPGKLGPNHTPLNLAYIIGSKL